MLKKLTLKNFVHFPDKHSFEFDEGSYFFIGENRSGKSCTFEAIRRCMSTSKNVFLSSSHDKTQPSVVVCEYKNIDSADERHNEFVSCYARIPNERGIYENDVVVRLVSGKSKESELFVDLVKKVKRDYPLKKAYPFTKDIKAKLLKELGDGVFSIDCVERCINDHVVGTQSFRDFMSREQDGNKDDDAQSEEDTDCERFLKENIDTQVVITDPMRMTCPAQWTNSNKLSGERKGGQFHNEIRDNSEILRWYLDSEDISTEERKNVDHFFDILTDGSEIKFEKNNGLIEVLDDDNVVSLGKTPEGLFEAKVCAILLSIKRFKTICLEEPATGMHSQMIERLRDLILRRIKDKTVIIISHIPTFLTSWNIEHIFFFRKRLNPERPGTFAVVNGKALIGTDENKTRRMITNHSLATIFFARRVLLVEGESDVMFMSAVRSILLNDEDFLEQLVARTKVDVRQEHVYRCISSLHILPLKGEPNKLYLEKVCKALGLERYFIFDFDALVENEKDKQSSTEQFFTKFDLKHLQEGFGSRNVEVLEEEGIFVWAIPRPREERETKSSTMPIASVGTIEDALLDLMDTAGDNLKAGNKLKTIFDDNNAKLTRWYRGKKKKPEHKLFSSKDLTEENIDSVVRAVLKTCAEFSDSDVFRMIRFLLNAGSNCALPKLARRRKQSK